MRKKIIITVIVIAIIILGILLNNKNIFSNADESKSEQEEIPIAQQNLTIDEKVDKIVASMSKTEKIGQMVMIGIQGTKVDDDSLYMLHQFHMGGVILFDRNMESPEQVKQLTSDL